MQFLLLFATLFIVFRLVKAYTAKPKMARQEIVKKVQQLIKDNAVFVASKSYCPYCQSAKGTLSSLGVKPFILELNQIDDGSDIQDALRELTGQSTVPNIFIDGEHIGGNSDLQALNSTGKLEKLLKL